MEDVLTDVDELKAIKWRCRRGMLELDLLLENFVEQMYTQISLTGQNNFKLLLEQPCQELFDWIIGDKVPEDPRFQDLVLMIRYIAPTHALK